MREKKVISLVKSTLAPGIPPTHFTQQQQNQREIYQRHQHKYGHHHYHRPCRFDQSDTDHNENYTYCHGFAIQSHRPPLSSISGGNYLSLLLIILLFLSDSNFFTPIVALDMSSLQQTVVENNTATPMVTGDYVTNADSLKDSNQVPNKPHLLNQMDSDADSKTNEEDSKNPSEVQKAVCTITAGEVKASAEAVTTKTLKGVCGSAELHNAVDNLEAKLFKELEFIKTLLREHLAQSKPTNCNCKNDASEKNVVNSALNVISTHTTTSNPIIAMTTPVSSMAAQPVSKNIVETAQRIQQHANNASNAHDNSPRLKSLHMKKPLQPREREVSKFNNTLLTDRDLKVFTYYWRLENFTARIKNDNNNIAIESPRFTIKRKPLHMKAYFNHLHRDFLYLQLEYATTKPSTNNIMLDMGIGGLGGGLFKEIASEDSILFKYKISILDQHNLRSPNDLVSQEFHNLDIGFQVPNSALLVPPYIKNDTLLIQLFLYL